MKLFYRLSHWTLNAFFFLFYRHRIYAKKNIPKGPAIFAPNHASYYDPPLVGASCPEEIHYLAREQLFRNPLLRLIITNLNAYPVHGSTDDLSTFKLICRLLKEGKKVVIFPEGARTEDGELSPIKTGVGMLALRNKVPIVPVYIHGVYDIWPIHNRFPKLRGRTRIVFGEPIDWQPYAEMNKKEAYDTIAKRVEDEILRLKTWLEEHHLS